MPPYVLLAYEDRASRLIRPWLGSLAARSMFNGLPTRFCDSPFGESSRPLFREIVIQLFICSRAYYRLGEASRMRVVYARSATLLRWISSWYFW